MRSAGCYAWASIQLIEEGSHGLVYVRPLPDVARGQWHVSIDGDGGTRPLWSRDSRELFYLSLTGALMRVGVAPGPTWEAGAPTKLFEGRYGAAASQTGRTYDVAADGKRLLMIKPIESADRTAERTSLVVVQNWQEELKRLVPTGRDRARLHCQPTAREPRVLFAGLPSTLARHLRRRERDDQLPIVAGCSRRIWKDGSAVLASHP